MNNTDISFEVSVTLSENRIAGSIANAPEGADFAFELYHFRNQKDQRRLVARTKYAAQSSCSFELEEIGYYYVRCFVQWGEIRRDRGTYSVLYLDDKFRKRFDDVMGWDLTTSNTCQGAADYFKAPSPQNDFCLISEKGERKKMPGVTQFCMENGMNFQRLETPSHWNTQNTLITDSTGTQPGFQENRVFSGYAWINGKFYHGQSQLDEGLDLRDAEGQCGVFSLLDIREDCIKATTDFFGYSRLFYYRDGDRLMVSNRYHLLLLVMGRMGLDCEIDEELVRTLFASNVTLFRQTFTERLTVKNTYMLHINNEIVIDAQGWSFPYRKIHQVMNSSTKFDPQRYAQLIQQAKQEIVDKVRALAECKAFDHIVLDLSGGKDSRTIVAAATHLPGSRDIFEIRSDSHEPDDLKIAIGVNNALGYPYYTAGDQFFVSDPRDYILKKRSYFCGYHYLWYFEQRHSGNQKKLRVSGESFESATVRYYSATVAHLNLEDATACQLASAYSEMVSKQPLTGYHEVAPFFEKQLAEELEKIPSHNALEAFDNMLLYYRGSTHAGNLDRLYYASACCNPLQSPSALEAKKMWFHNFQENKIVWDIMHALHPLLDCMPYNSSKNNKSRQNAEENMLIDERFRHCRISLDYNSDRYDRDMRELQKNTTTTIDEKYQTYMGKMGNTHQLEIDNCLLGLQKLCGYHGGLWKYDLCMPIYYYVLAEMEDPDEVRIVHNKIFSVLDCMDAAGVSGRPAL